MDNLTPRQIQILKCIIEEYLETAEPVGSDTLERKYTLGVSPATIRNEMANLAADGFLRQPHTSAGRVPTPKALRFYIEHLMEEQKLSVAEEVAAKERLEEAKSNFYQLMQEATRALSELTNSLTITVTDNGEVWHAGYARILAAPEFYNIDVTIGVLSFLEEHEKILELFRNQLGWEEPVEVVFGEDLRWPNFDAVGMVVSKFENSQTKGVMGAIGPARLNFPFIIPAVRYFSQLLSQV